MSSDLCVFDDFSFSPFADSPIDFLQDPIFEDKIINLDQFSPNKFKYLTISSNSISQNHFSFDTQFSDSFDFEAKTQNFQTDPVLESTKDEITNLVRVAPTELENLSVSPKHNCQKDVDFKTRFGGFSSLEVKTQDIETRNDSILGYQSFGPHSYGGPENVERFMQRSYSSSSFNVKPGFSFRPNFDFVMENKNFESQQAMRRVCSTGDLQQVTKAQGTHGMCSSSSPLGVERSFIKEANFKVRRYSAEERKERIHKYRAKRNQRNFNKTIKYACRKTLADNRPRIRGRFTRNDETPKTHNFNSFEDQADELSWVDWVQ